MSRPQARTEPDGELAIRILAMPEHTNPSGDIFGGWIVSLMDLAGLSAVSKFAPKRRVVTAAINSMSFLAPVKVGDYVCCYSKVIETGRTSITANIEAWAVAADDTERRQVTEGVFTFVSVDLAGKPVPVVNPV